MHLTRKSSYGLIAALELANRPASGPVSAGAIAGKYALPSPFVEKILHQLKASGLVASQKGRGGGYTLTADPATLSVRRILEALGESLDLVGCLGPEPACHLVPTCPTKQAWERADRRFKELLDSISLRDFLAPQPGRPKADRRKDSPPAKLAREGDL